MNQCLEHTIAWVERWVVGLELCPFAATPFRRGRIRYTLAEGSSPASFHLILAKEAKLLTEGSGTDWETTLLIFPEGLRDFYDYLDYVGEAEELLRRSGYEGILQIASFHPDYQFADTAPEDVSNYTNRSPYPMIHLLREEQVESALNSYEEPEQIPLRNITKLQQMGLVKVKSELKAIEHDSRRKN